MARIQAIRQKVIDRRYFLSSHAEEEMAADGLERSDVENAMLKGMISRRLIADPRGARYRIKGPARDGRQVNVICRYHESGDMIVITVYAEPDAYEM